MKKTIFLAGLSWVVFFMIMGCSSSVNTPKTPGFQIESFPWEIDLDEFITYCQEADFTISYDPFFGPGTIFRGFSMNEGLHAVGVHENISAVDSLKIIFVCKDGYAPSMSLSDFLKRDAFILPQTEKDLPNWPEKLREKVLPYYITFTDARDQERLPFPYGTVKIKIDYAKTQYQHSFPEAIQKDSILSNGFAVFQHRCGKCHSINKEGGSVGPELNYPQSITEYRSKEYLYEFIKHPQSFRYNSKMPMMKLSDQDFELIYGYLKAIQEYKLEAL